MELRARPALPSDPPVAPGLAADCFGQPLNSRLGIAAGPLLNSKWVGALRAARLRRSDLRDGPFGVQRRPSVSPNIRHVDNREQAAVTIAAGPTGNGDLTIAVSLGEPSMEPDVWRKDVRRARERIGRGQVLIVSVVGTPVPGGDAEALVARLCAVCRVGGRGRRRCGRGPPGDAGSVRRRTPR